MPTTARLYELILALLLTSPISLYSQTVIPGNERVERLFCGSCGREEDITSKFCFDCGALLDKSALIRRLQSRFTEADSLKTKVTLTPDELRVLIDYETARKATPFPRPQPKPAEGFDAFMMKITPFAIGLGAFYMAMIATQTFTR